MQIVCLKLTVLHAYCSKGIILYTGCVEGTEVSHRDGRDCQCHLWNLLGHRCNTSRLGRNLLLSAQCACNAHCSHNGHVQIRCQSVCVCSDKPKVQREDEGNDMLQVKFICIEGSCCAGTT